MKNRSREAAKQETRDALVQAGVALYLQADGEPSLDAICASAGFTRGAFYVHFKDRTDFVFAVMDVVLRNFIDLVIADQGDGGGETGQRVSQTVSRFIESAQQDRGAATQGSVRFLAQVLNRYPEIKAQHGTVISLALSRVTGLILKEQAAGQIRQDVPGADIAFILVTSAMGIAGLLDADVEFDLSTLGATAESLIRV